VVHRGGREEDGQTAGGVLSTETGEGIMRCKSFVEEGRGEEPAAFSVASKTKRDRLIERLERGLPHSKDGKGNKELPKSDGRSQEVKGRK